jgi:flagellar protein FliS
MQAYPQGSGLAAYRSVAAHGGVAAADPHQLIVMLLDGALDRIAGARGAMLHGMQAEKGRLLHKAVEILDELQASLDRQSGGQIAANLSDLYDYAARQLMLGSVQNRSECLDEVANLLREIRSAWIAIAPQARGAARAAP